MGVTTTTHHTTTSYTHNIAIFAVFNSFWPVWRPIATSNELLCISWFFDFNNRKEKSTRSFCTRCRIIRLCSSREKLKTVISKALFPSPLWVWTYSHNAKYLELESESAWLFWNRGYFEQTSMPLASQQVRFCTILVYMR